MDGSTLHLWIGQKIVEVLLRGSLSISLGMLVSDVHEDRTPCVYKGVPTPWSFDCLLKDIRDHALKMITRLFTSKCAKLRLAGLLAISRHHCCSDTRACGTCCGTIEIKSYTTVAPNNEFTTQ